MAAKEIAEMPQPTEPIKPKSLIGKLAEAMATVGGVEKKGTNEAQRYNYVKAADVAKAVRHALFERGIIMISNVVQQDWSEFQTVAGKRMTVCRLTVKYTLYDADSQETVAFSGVGEAFDTGDKAVYKAHTGALKYALRSIGLIPDEKDDPEADEKVDKEMAADAVAKVEAEHLAKFKEREAKQIPVVEELRPPRKAEGYVLIEKCREMKDKKGKPYWLITVIDRAGGSSDVAVWDQKLRIPELWDSAGKDAKIRVSEKKIGDKTYYTLEQIYVIGAKAFSQEPKQDSLLPADEMDVAFDAL